MSRNREGRLHDAISEAQARDVTADKTGRRRDNLRFVMATWKVAWRAGVAWLAVRFRRQPRERVR